MWARSSDVPCLNYLSLALCLAMSASVMESTAQVARLEIEVRDIHPGKGFIKVGVFGDAASFRTRTEPAYARSLPAIDSVVRHTFDEVIAGNYAVAIYHDENGDDSLNVRKLGIPEEGVGFSGAMARGVKPPDFQKASFQLVSDTAIAVIMKYPANRAR